MPRYTVLFAIALGCFGFVSTAAADNIGVGFLPDDQSTGDATTTSLAGDNIGVGQTLDNIGVGNDSPSWYALLVEWVDDSF